MRKFCHQAVAFVLLGVFNQFSGSYSQILQPGLGINLGPGGINGVSGTLNCFQQFQSASQSPNPDIGLKIDQLITKYGYPVEVHNVTTSDGYILTVFRIPHGKTTPSSGPKKAIYLNHGLLSNGQQWILQYGDRNLGFMLADAGFDVFISNCRGSTYSQRHANLTTSDSAYWNFSWDEMGRYDVPAVMNMITNVTGNQKMYYAGHSMGTTQFFVAMSQHPELNSRIVTAFLLSPIAFIPHSTNVARLIAPLAYNLQDVFNLAVNGELSTSQTINKYTGLTLGSLCATSAATCGACSNLLFALFGYDPPQTNYTSLPVALNVLPDTASTKSIIHYAQSISARTTLTSTTGTFRQFDYGTPMANQDKYGSPTPPAYNLSLITAPVVFFYGQNDNLGVPQDVEYTASKLLPDTLKLKILVNNPLFTHIDFAIAIDADKFVYNTIKGIMINGTYES